MRDSARPAVVPLRSHGQEQRRRPDPKVSRRRKYIPPGAPRRMLDRLEVAVYVGISTTKFDEMVADGRMPRPTRIDGRVLWDIRKVDAAIDALDTAEEDDQGWGDMRA